MDTIILKSRITNIAQSLFNMNFDKYPWIKDNTIVSKFDYFIIYSITLECRIIISDWSLITYIIKLLLSTPLIANDSIL